MKVALRLKASQVPSIQGLTVSGNPAVLVDISTSGLLAELGVALTVGASVKVTFEGESAPMPVRARVARSSVAAMTPAGLRYHAGLAFVQPIVLHEAAALEATADSSEAPAAAPEEAVVTVMGPAAPSGPKPVFNRW
jgi:hypothetical protein